MKLNSQDIEKLEERFRALFINSLSGYKSANLLGTIDGKGCTNLAIVSSVFHLGANPPLMGMIMRPHSVRRDSLENILDTGVYTLNHVNQAIFQQAHQTSARFDQDVSEFDKVGLTAEFSPGFSAPFVAESRLSIGLKLVESQCLKVNGTELVIGEIVLVQVDDQAVQTDGHIDLEKLCTVSVSGLDSYHKSTKLARLAYAKPDRPVMVLDKRPD